MVGFTDDGSDNVIEIYMIIINNLQKSSSPWFKNEFCFCLKNLNCCALLDDLLKRLVEF